MNNLLEVDLNEFVSNKIAERISSLEKQITTYTETIYKQSLETENLKKQVVDSATAFGLLTYLRDEFSKITKTEKNDSDVIRGKQQNQFLFIEKVLLNIFNIKKEDYGWYGCNGIGRLASNLAVNYYSKKEVVINLLKILMADCGDIIQFIQSFRMPFDYTKEEVLEYVKAPRYNTNGCIFGITEYWVNSEADKVNMPHDLIMKNPFILKDDIFEILIESINKKVSNYYYLFALPRYNKSISNEQIIALGECLMSIEDKVWKYEQLEYFIKENIKKFNEKTLDFLYTKIQHDDQYKVLHWEKFPNEYQMRFLKNKPLDEVLKLITAYSCTWTLEQKEFFLKEYCQSLDN